MYYWLILCLFTFTPHHFGLRVASWNVKDYGLTDQRIDNQFLPHYPKPENEKKSLREIIHGIQPDILLLQEIGGLHFLKELQTDLKLEGTLYPYIFCLEAADPQRKIAILSKKEVLSYTLEDKLSYRTNNGDTFPILRGLLGITIQLNPTQILTLYNIHLKSKRETSKENTSTERRRAEALVLRNVIHKNHPIDKQDLFLVAGDFNDAYRKPAVQLFLKKNDNVLMHLVPLTDTRNEAWTHAYRYEDAYTRIDHFLISPALKPYITPFQGYINDTPNALIASDHRLIYIDIQESTLKNESKSNL